MFQKLFLPFTVQIIVLSDLKFCANSLEFQKLFSITRIFFIHSKSEQFRKQNTIYKLEKIGFINLQEKYIRKIKKCKF